MCLRHVPAPGEQSRRIDPRVDARLVDAGNRADTGKAVVDIAARDPEQRAIFGTIALEQRLVGARIERREGVALTAGGPPCPPGTGSAPSRARGWQNVSNSG